MQIESTELHLKYFNVLSDDRHIMRERIHFGGLLV